MGRFSLLSAARSKIVEQAGNYHQPPQSVNSLYYVSNITRYSRHTLEEQEWTKNIRPKLIFASPAVRCCLCFLVSPGSYRWRRVWRACCGGCRGRRLCSRDAVCGARGPSLCTASQTQGVPHPKECGPRASRRSGFRVGYESKLFSGYQTVRIQVTRSRGGGDLGRDGRCRRLLVPIECLEVVAHELFVERRL